MMGSHHQRLLEASAFSDREIGVYDEHGDSVSAVRPPQTPKNVEGDRPDFISSIPTRLMNRLRRPHHKSRSGCRNCKTRKVKCDEGRPQCHRCQVYGISCSYVWSTTKAHPRTLACRQSPVHENASLAQSAVNSNIHAALRSHLCDREDDWSAGLSQAGSVEIAALSHFSRMVALEEPFFPHIKKVFRDHAIPVAFQDRCLLHSILAVANTHQAQFLSDRTELSLAATRFRHKAIQLYRRQLSGRICKHNMDVLLSTCILVGMFSFSTDKRPLRDSWVFSDDPTAMNWLSVQGGLWSLLTVVSPWLEESVWRDSFREASDYQVFENLQSGREGLDPELADLCDIDETTTAETNAFYWPLRMLCPMLAISRSDLSPSRSDISRITNFMGRLLPDYLALLRAKEPRALLILSYWLALLSSVGEWWIESRARSECQAICMFLEHNPDPRIVGLLNFPATSCGYRCCWPIVSRSGRSN